MAGPNVIYASGKFSWSYAPVLPDPWPATELRLKWGTAPGVYPNQKVYAPTTTGADVNTVLPVGSGGQFYARLYPANATKEGTGSTEVPFVLGDGSPNGSLTFSIG
jgi:hypothetical protein